MKPARSKSYFSIGLASMGREWALMFIPFGASTALVLATDKIANNALIGLI